MAGEVPRVDGLEIRVGGGGRVPLRARVVTLGHQQAGSHDQGLGAARIPFENRVHDRARLRAAALGEPQRGEPRLGLVGPVRELGDRVEHRHAEIAPPSHQIVVREREPLVHARRRFDDDFERSFRLQRLARPEVEGRKRTVGQHVARLELHRLQQLGFGLLRPLRAPIEIAERHVCGGRAGCDVDRALERGFGLLELTGIGLHDGEIAVKLALAGTHLDGGANLLDGGVEILQASQRVRAQHKRPEILRVPGQHPVGSGASIIEAMRKQEHAAGLDLQVRIVWREVGGPLIGLPRVQLVTTVDGHLSKPHIWDGRFRIGLGGTAVLEHGVGVLPLPAVGVSLCNRRVTPALRARAGTGEARADESDCSDRGGSTTHARSPHKQVLCPAGPDPSRSGSRRSQGRLVRRSTGEPEALTKVSRLQTLRR